MAYLIIGMSFALILGSLMWMLPSINEKRLATLRAKAAAANFHPKFIKYESYLSLIPKRVKEEQAKPESQIVRYFWQGSSPLKTSRSLQFVFSDKQELLTMRLNDLELDKQNQGPFQEQIELALKAAHYFSGLLALECKDAEGTRLLSLYWLEQGDIKLIDFKGEEVQGLQRRL